ncbi:hypothetical protein ES703_83371 [subsurface metagenome]
MPDSKIIEAILGRDPADGEWTDQMNANAKKVNVWWDGKGGKIDAFKLKIGRRVPITDKSGPLKYNWRQTASRMAILMGARGGVDIPDEQRKPTYNRIAKVYKMFDKPVPEFREYTEENKVKEELRALKEGRVLSEKNRKLVKQCADMLLQLYEATEPPKREEIEIEDNEKKAPAEENLTKEQVIEIFKDIKSGPIDYRALAKRMIDKAKGKVE